MTTIEKIYRLKEAIALIKDATKSESTMWSSDTAIKYLEDIIVDLYKRLK